MRESKAYLIRFSRLKKYIRARSDELVQLRDSLIPSSIDYSGITVQTSPDDKMAAVMARIDALERKVQAATSEALDTLAEIEDTIQKIEDMQLQALIIHHYINDLTWEETAEVMGFDLRWVYRLHGKALDEVDKLLRHEKPF